MNGVMIAGMLLAFAVGTAIAWVQARRRIRAQLREQLVAEAEARIKAEMIRRVAEKAKQEVDTSN